MSTKFLIDKKKLIELSINENAEEIERLDQEIGDGDHIFNVQRGIKLVIELESSIKDLPMSKALNTIAMKVLSGIGGSSGALFGTLFMTMAKGKDIDQGIDFDKTIEIFYDAVQAVKMRGKAEVGEKTMMDVLIPVANTLKNLSAKGEDKNNILNEVIKIAKEGMLSTKDLLATKGRASFLGERARGHIDPGARSSQIMITTVCESVINS